MAAQITSSSSARSVEPPYSDRPSAIDGTALVELALALSVRRGATLVLIEPRGDRYELRAERGRRLLGRLSIAADVAACAVGHLARITGLDPLVEAGTPEGLSNLARLTVRAERSSAQLIVSIVAHSTGFEAEIRATAVDDRPIAPESAVRSCPHCGMFTPPTESICPRDRAPLVDVEDDPRVGGSLGPHRLDQVLGSGAMGTVFAATHVLLGRPAAIKVLHWTLAHDAQQSRAFLSEARAASRVCHPSVLEVTDYGILADGRPFVVMERLEGESLATRIDREGALPPAAALRIARMIAEALEAAHDAGVVHNDLKPSNVMLLDGSSDFAPRLKVIDFGAASLIELRQQDSDLVVGTPQYMSPEQIRGAVTDGRSDLYALGVVLFRLLSGELPFERSEVDELLTAHLTVAPPPVTSPLASLPQAVTRLVARMLAKSADARHQTAAEVVTDIDRAIAAVERPSWRRWLP
ncbi:MAG: serine/threonine protein kinase [Deltaproteobacteria bacterium]|nr:serine/threonine protein kinase [Deltaproteobacteria bacterium]